MGTNVGDTAGTANGHGSLVRRRQDRRTDAPRPAPALASAARSAQLDPWLRAQVVNAVRHASALRPFSRGEFGDGAAAPTDAHIHAANALLNTLRRTLLRKSRLVTVAVALARRRGSARALAQVVHRKEHAQEWVRRVEQIWDFYFELFGQRQSRYAEWLLACDRIALNSYQAAYMGLGRARSIPTPPPFCYMRTGFSPATFRRGIPLRRIGRNLNPFVLIQLPYHRLVNAWTLGAVLHECGHSLQNELGLAAAIAPAVRSHLARAGVAPGVIAICVRWEREVFADLLAVLMGGPAVVASLMDVIGRSRASTCAFDPRGVHPTPYLRTHFSAELLRRLGFESEARAYRRTWGRLYPTPRRDGLPESLLHAAPAFVPRMVDAMCFRPYPTLGDKALADVVRFGAKEQAMVEEAAGRLATGMDPGVIPERFLIGASRHALDHRLAAPHAISEAFYRELARR